MDESTVRRFWAKVNTDGPIPANHPELGKCWLWKPLGSLSGYGQFFMNGKPGLAHRAAYKILVGPIPDGLVIDHRCEVRNCVRPAHLEPVTRRENSHRAKTWQAGAAANREKTHCASGHPYSGDNLRITAGRRCCRTCDRRYSAEHRGRHREANPVNPRHRRTHCVNGHEFALVGKAGRGCAECSRNRVRARREQLKAVQPPKPPRTHCLYGHPWTAENIYVNPAGQRSCRPCHSEKSLAKYHARKAAVAA